MNLNENNIQAPFQYKISDKTFELKTVSGGFSLNTDNVHVKVFSGERLFCADIGYAVDGAVEEMEFLINGIKVYPQVLESLEDLQTVQVKDNEVYLIRNELDFKSIVFFPPSDLNKKFDFTITTYSSTFSSFMFDEIAKRLNTLDINYPIKNYYENTDYKINDIIKYNGYLYRVFKDFTSDSTDYYLKSNCNILTPFKKLELDSIYKANELVEYNNNFFIVQKDFVYQKSLGVLTNLNGLLKPLQDIIIWFDGITKIYKNQIVIKDNILYKVLEDIDNPIWDSIQQKIETLIKADNTFYDDSNSSFGNNTNTVQKAIEKLKSNKQDSLIAGNNINLYGNAISVEGGVNKEYELGSLYIINDLIIKDDKIYKVNESFTASNWNMDISKCVLISTGGGNGSSEAIDVSFDNTNAKLQQLAGYDFPKFKTEISETIDFVNAENIAISIKKTNNDYFIEYKALSPFIANNQIILHQENTNLYKLHSTINQFFETVSESEETYYEALDGEILWEEITNIEELQNNPPINEDGSINYDLIETRTLQVKSKFKITNGINSYNFLIIKSEALEEIAPNTICLLTLNIKNRVLRNEDTNIFACSNGFMTTQKIIDFYHFTLVQNNDTVILKGEYTQKEGAGLTIGFYSPIIENYFDTPDISSVHELKNTNGITSSSGKPLKFAFAKANQTELGALPYLLLLMYQDDTDIQVGDTITFNLTPDKNFMLNPIYQYVRNVQQLGEVLNDKDLELGKKIDVLSSLYMIPAYYTQYANASGVFD
ncbi:phage tail protein, partial [Brachyspira innocens]